MVCQDNKVKIFSVLKRVIISIRINANSFYRDLVPGRLEVNPYLYYRPISSGIPGAVIPELHVPRPVASDSV